MQITDTITSLAALIFVGIIATWLYTRIKNIQLPFSRKTILTTAIVSFLIMITFGSMSGNNTSNNSTTSNSSSSSVTSSKSSSPTESEKATEASVLQSLSKSELKAYNSGLIDSLGEDQNYSKNGKSSYDWSTYVDTMVYDNRGLVIKVTPDFLTLNDKDKTFVAKHAQGLANAQVVILGKEVDKDTSPHTSFYLGTKRLGHSKAWNTSEFKWSKER